MYQIIAGHLNYQECDMDIQYLIHQIQETYLNELIESFKEALCLPHYMILLNNFEKLLANNYKLFFVNDRYLRGCKICEKNVYHFTYRFGEIYLKGDRFYFSINMISKLIRLIQKISLLIV